MRCSICENTLNYPDSFASMYPNLVCDKCDSRAVNCFGEKALIYENITVEDGVTTIESLDDGDNPVFIDGHKCWRRYRFGGYVTMRDDYDCADIMEFYKRHMSL